MSKASENGRMRIKFEVNAEKGKEIYLAGSFNNWNPKGNKMKFNNGSYSLNVLLPKGRYEYKYVIDGKWVADSECPDWMPNNFGTINSVLIVE